MISMRNLLRLMCSLLCATAANAGEFSFQGQVKTIESWSREANPRKTVSLAIASGDVLMDELVIIFDPRDGSIESITWRGKNPENLTKAAPKIPQLIASEKGRRFHITFKGERFDTQQQEKLFLSKFEWASETK